jgi:hypothetical protein
MMQNPCPVKGETIAAGMLAGPHGPEAKAMANPRRDIVPVDLKHRYGRQRGVVAVQ